MEAFFNVQNVMDTDPPVVGGAPGGFSYEQPSTNDGLYDVMGRTFRAGLRFRPLAVTVRDTLEWQRKRPAEKQQRLAAGLAADEEAQLLAKWQAKTAVTG